MPNITVRRNRIIVGPVHRFEIDPVRENIEIRNADTGSSLQWAPLVEGSVQLVDGNNVRYNIDSLSIADSGSGEIQFVLMIPGGDAPEPAIVGRVFSLIQGDITYHFVIDENSFVKVDTSRWGVVVRRVVSGRENKQFAIGEATFSIVYDVGGTRGDVIVRKVVQQGDIGTDIGSIIDKFRLNDRMFIDVNLAESTFENLKIAWGGNLTEDLDVAGKIRSRSFDFRYVSGGEVVRKLVLEGPDVDGFVQRYIFPRVVSLSQSNQVFSKSDVRSIPVTFEVLTEIRNFETNVGIRGQTTILDWKDGLSVVKDQIVVDDYDVLWVALSDDDGSGGEPSENSNFEKYNAAFHNRASFGSVRQFAHGTPYFG